MGGEDHGGWVRRSAEEEGGSPVHLRVGPNSGESRNRKAEHPCDLAMSWAFFLGVGNGGVWVVVFGVGQVRHGLRAGRLRRCERVSVGVSCF